MAYLKWWWLIVLLTILGGAVGYVVTDRIEPVYQANASILVGRPLLDPTVSRDDIETSAQLASTYADVAGRQPILEATVRGLGLDLTWQQLGEQVAASVSRQQSQVVVVTVDAASTQEATSIGGRGGRSDHRDCSDRRSRAVVRLESPTIHRRPPPSHRAADRPTRAAEHHRPARTGAASRPSGVKDANPHQRQRHVHLVNLQQTYSSLLGFVEGTRVSNHLQVLEEPGKRRRTRCGRACPSTWRSERWPGSCFGLAIAHLLSLRRGPLVVDRPVLLPDAMPDEPQPESERNASSFVPDYDAGETAARFFFQSDPEAH